MDNQIIKTEMLALLAVPAFIVENGIIRSLNSAARGALLSPGEPVEPYLATGMEEYRSLREGSLFLTLELPIGRRQASVYYQQGVHLFVVERGVKAELHLLSLVAQKLREPLNDIMAVADQMFPELLDSEDPDRQRQMAQMNRGLHRILRALGNMSDAEGYQPDSVVMEPTELGAFFFEIFQRAEPLGEAAGVKMEFRAPSQPVQTMANRGRLERAVYNLLSNSLKFTPRGGMIRMELEKRGDLAVLTVTDNGEGISRELLGTVFARYQREPAPDDYRWGIGLGLSMVSGAAAAHGGTLLLRPAAGGGTVAAMSIRLKNQGPASVSATRLRVDYAGEHDHGLVELADSLPWEVFEAGSIN